MPVPIPHLEPPEGVEPAAGENRPELGDDTLITSRGCRAPTGVVA